MLDTSPKMQRSEARKAVLLNHILQTMNICLCPQLSQELRGRQVHASSSYKLKPSCRRYRK